MPWAIREATATLQSQNPGVTDVVRIPGRGHPPTIDSGWKEVADDALAFVTRVAPA